jgi:hypothetical protein
VIKVWRHQQSAGAVEAFGVGGVSPWLDVTRLSGDRGIRVPIRLSDETNEGISECLRELSEIDGP